MTDEQPQPNLGLATTRQLLDELRARIDVDYASGGGGLDYTTVGGRPLPERKTRWRPIASDGTISPDPAPENPPEPDPVGTQNDGETGPPEVQL